jgi:hypothetical protein
MADEQSNDSADSGSGSLVSSILSGLGKTWDFVTGSPAINAMGRQGLDELGAALKAFPDSIAEYRYNRGYLDDSNGYDPAASTLLKADDAAIRPPDTGKVNDNGTDAGYSM